VACRIITYHNTPVIQTAGTKTPIIHHSAADTFCNTFAAIDVCQLQQMSTVMVDSVDGTVSTVVTEPNAYQFAVATNTGRHTCNPCATCMGSIR